MEPTAHILLFPLSLLSLLAFHGDKMNSALNLINPQRFHVLIPKVKGVIVLTNEVSVPPCGNKGKKECETEGVKGKEKETENAWRVAFFLCDSLGEWRYDIVARGHANRDSVLLSAPGLWMPMCKEVSVLNG